MAELVTFLMVIVLMIVAAGIVNGLSIVCAWRARRRAFAKSPDWDTEGHEGRVA